MGEIELLKNLNHKNIVKYIGSFKTRTHLYIILEYMDRGAISSVIKPSQFGAFPESLVAVYIAQVDMSPEVPSLQTFSFGKLCSARAYWGRQHCYIACMDASTSTCQM